MSTPTESATQAGTAAEVLYVAVDLGARPQLRAFQRNVSALTNLAGIAEMMAEDPAEAAERIRAQRRSEVYISPRMFRGIGHLPDPGTLRAIRLVRTSLASPWVSVLAELARTSSPIGYGAAGLYALHQLLRMVMTWQTHRLEIAERTQQMELLRQQAARQTGELGRELLRDRQTDLSTFNRTLAAHEQDGQTPLGDQVADFGAEMGTIETVELVNPQDPRATGADSAEKP